MLSMREKYKAGNSLICLLQALTGRVTTVELRNESFAQGHIKNVDGFMNVEMTAVTFTSPDGKISRMDNFFVQGPQIRYVQIPDDINIVNAMQQQIAMIGFGCYGTTGGRGRGRGRGQGRRRGRGQGEMRYIKPPTERPQQSTNY